MCRKNALSSVTPEGAAKWGPRPVVLGSSVSPHSPDIFPVCHPNLAVNFPSNPAEARAPLAHLLGLWWGGLEFTVDQPVAKQQKE